MARLELELYRRYTRHQAIAACSGSVFSSFFRRLGLSGEPRELCDGQWVIFPNEAICFANLGVPPHASHFETPTARFGWVPDEPYQVNEDRSIPSLPAEVTAGDRRPGAIRLFARRGNLADFVYLGTIDPSQTVKPGGYDHRYGAVYFALSPAIPSELLAELRGPPLVEPTAVDAALDRLRGTTTADDRFAILQTLVQYRTGPIIPDDALPEEAIRHLRLPTPLRRWYRWAGRRNIINFFWLQSPDKLESVDGRLLYCYEHQGCYSWSTPTDGDDPIVFGQYYEEKAWVAEDLTLTEQLITALVFELALNAPYSAQAVSLDRAVFDQLVEKVPPLAIPPWRYDRMRFYGRNGAFMATMLEDDESATVFIGAETHISLQFLKPIIGDTPLPDPTWVHIAIDADAGNTP